MESGSEVVPSVVSLLRVLAAVVRPGRDTRGREKVDSLWISNTFGDRSSTGEVLPRGLSSRSWEGDTGRCGPLGRTPYKRCDLSSPYSEGRE